MISVAKPKKFVIGIKNAGTDSCNSHFKGQFEDTNPINLGMQICNLMGMQFAGEQHSPYFQYWLACRILKGLEFDKTKLLKDVENSLKEIKRFDLEDYNKNQDDANHADLNEKESGE